MDLQAMARVWRDGQKKPCVVYRLLTTGGCWTGWWGGWVVGGWVGGQRLSAVLSDLCLLALWLPPPLLPLLAVALARPLPPLQAPWMRRSTSAR